MRRGLKEALARVTGRDLIHSSIFPDEEGTERLDLRHQPLELVPHSSIFPDEEGTESLIRTRPPRRRVDSSIFPDEEGTERLDTCEPGCAHSPDSSIFPDEEGTERGLPGTATEPRCTYSSIFPDEEGTERGVLPLAASRSPAQQHLPR